MKQHLDAYRQEVENHLQAISFSGNPNELYEPIRYLIGIGGKRIRPLLCMLSCELFGKKGADSLHAGVAVELFHNFTLIHDDIMDEAPLRRGFPSVHAKWNEKIALLSGDTLFVTAYRQLAQQDATVLPELISLFSITAQEVCEGQQMDMDFEQMPHVRIEEYIEMVRLKTAVLLAGALEMGAIVAGASLAQRKQIYRFGEQIGIAFQLQDDLLDVFAEGDAFGKQVGGDILANKKTYLSITAKEHANSVQKNALLELEVEENKAEKVSKTVQLFQQLDIQRKAEQEITHRFNEALKSLSNLEVPEANKKTLFALAHYLMQRKH